MVDGKSREIRADQPQQKNMLHSAVVSPHQHRTDATRLAPRMTNTRFPCGPRFTRVLSVEIFIRGFITDFIVYRCIHVDMDQY